MKWIVLIFLVFVSGCSNKIQIPDKETDVFQGDDLKPIRKIEYRDDGWMGIYAEEESFPGIICVPKMGCLDRRKESHELYLQLRNRK